jgi:DNA-binding response OmpR family regulator
MPKGPGELRGLRVLVVEDSFLVADAICDVLSESGCEVVGPAPNLERGWRLSQQETLDGAVLDVNLGGEHSFPIAVTLAERGIPFLFLTGYDDVSVMPAEFRTVHRILKPFDFNELVDIIAKSFTANSRPSHK